MIWVFLVNLGRTKRASTVARAMRLIRGHIGKRRAVLALVEMDEGDKTIPSDHALLRVTFTLLHRWHRAWMSKREVLLSHRIRARHGLGKSVHACDGLPHESPSRSWQASVYPTTAGLVAVVTGHPPAGAHNGRRPARVKAELLDRYAQTEAAEKQIVTDMLKVPGVVGVVIAADRNRRDYKPLHPHEVIVAHHGPDYISAVPAAGHDVHHGHPESMPQPVEALHRLIGAPVEFVAKVA